MKIEMDISPQGQIDGFSIDGTACDIIPRTVAPGPAPDPAPGPAPAPSPQPQPPAEKLPRLTGDLFNRMVVLQRTAHFDQGLADALGDNYSAYVSYAYGPAGYYWQDILDFPPL